ncbi:MAG: hypothetical protein ACNFW9_06180 [Candidatus Kerfeldbacteria bacterium]
MNKLLKGGDPLGALLMKSVSDLGIQAGVEVPIMHPDEFDEFKDRFLLRGAMFWGILEEMYYITQIADYYSGKKDTPFFDPQTQMWGFNRFAGLMCMKCMTAVDLILKTKSMPKTEEKDELKKSIKKSVKSGRWPKNALVIFNFGDAHLNAQLAWITISWMYQGAIATDKFFQKELLRTDKMALDMPIGYNVIELPEKDWHHGVGASYKGVTSSEVKSQLKDGWKLMSWEGLQLLGYMPYYACFMNTVRVPNMLLSGFRSRMQNSGHYSLIPYVSFDKKEMELQLGYNPDENIADFYGHGVVRHLGPLQHFIY